MLGSLAASLIDKLFGAGKDLPAGGAYKHILYIYFFSRANSFITITSNATRSFCALARMG